MKEYFTVENCTPEELEAAGYETPDDVPNWIIHQEYARILFTEDDFWCTAGKTD